MNINKIKKIYKITKYIQKKYKYERLCFSLIIAVFTAMIYFNLHIPQKLLRYYIKVFIKLIIIFYGAFHFLFSETKQLIYHP